MLRSKNQYRPKQNPDRRRITSFGIGFYRLNRSSSPTEEIVFLKVSGLQNHKVKEKYHFISKIRFYRQISSKKVEYAKSTCFINKLQP